MLRLDQSWTYKANVLADLISRKVAAGVQKSSGLNLSQWRVLAAVADGPGRTASQVVSMTPMDKGIVSRAVKTLIARGILERRSSEQDGRSSHLFLTSEGENVYSSIVAELDTSGATGRASIVEAEQQEFITALDRMIEKYTSFEN